jgi:hypothetical protein
MPAPLSLSDRQLRWIEIAVMLILSGFPAIFSLPFRIHLDLPWEGAYRMTLGQMPFRDFKMPLGYGFLIILWAFFKIFGPYIFTLIYAQIFINVVAAVAFRNILKLLNVKAVYILLGVFTLCVSYNFLYFWPWYNHTAVMYELLAFNFLLLAMLKEKSGWKHGLNLFLSAVFVFLTFFTKQDYGGLAFIFACILLAYYSFIEKKWLDLPVFAGFFGLTALLFILPLVPHGFGYWFNYGQPPHESRLSLVKLLDAFFGENSAWEKFYLLAMSLVLLQQLIDFKAFIQNKQQVLLTLITLGFIAQALITKVTSRHSIDNTTYYHAFAVVFLLQNMNLKINLARLPYLAAVLGLMFVWWSGMYWKYATRLIPSLSPPVPVAAADTVRHVPVKWMLSPYRSFRKITLPEPTVAGIEKIKNLPVVRNKKDLKVLNMSELTMLAYELPYTPQKNLPLWYHLHIGMFDKEVAEISEKIRNKEYDLILFEDVPILDNFFPYILQKVMKENYQLQDRFLAPRKEEDSYIEVFVR